MKSYEIRRVFLDYFKKNGHTIVDSAPLVPKSDPSLLFVNAGMVQFKNVFLGLEKRSYTRAASCQKCMRAGGKHSDLENVGHTPRHHTFFEMLGNFSFGDYFKKEAIHYAWDFLTNVLNLPENKLYITIFKEDDEAFDIWHKQEGISEDHIRRMDEKDNFWAMGDTGPCGPCSEVHIEQGKNELMELWNIVFMQFDRKDDGRLVPLPKPSIDTGMGLERITAVMENVYSNFDTDLFVDIIASIVDLLHVRYGKDEDLDVSIRIIADHLRACVFLIADGILPDKEGRGYVLRRIIRRAMRQGNRLGKNEPFLYRLAPVVIETMKDVYSEIGQMEKFIANVLKNEEEQFSRTLNYGLKLLYEIAEKTSGKVVSGKEIFKLYDTYGFPVDIAIDILSERGLKVDLIEFNRLMEEQKKKAKEAWTGSGEEKVAPFYGDMLKRGETKFVGYEKLMEKCKVLSIAKDGVLVEEAQGECDVTFDKTPFYGQGGGQVSDTGRGFSEGLSIKIKDVKRYFGGRIFVHHVNIENGTLKTGNVINLVVDEERRKDIQRHHTATHLLQAALRKVLGKHVHQAGSLVAPDRLRFDFTHFSHLYRKEVEAVERYVNEWIVENIPVCIEWKSYKEALEEGAMAVFEEKYEDRVRVVTIGDVSKELCGGTHVKRTGDIGFFKIIGESAVARGVRRIEAKCGLNAYEYIRRQEDKLWEALNKIKCSSLDELVEKHRELQEELKKTRRLKKEKPVEIKNIRRIDGFDVVSKVLEGYDPSDLRNLSDVLRSRITSGVVILFNKTDGKVGCVVNVSRDAAHRFNASDIVKKISSSLGGSGGGRRDFAQGGGKRVELVEDIIQNIEKYL